MKKLIDRIQLNLLKRHLKKFPVIAVVGARQVGKTTIVRDLLHKKMNFYTFDDPATVLAAEKNPLSFLNQAERIIIDEVQKAPSILSGIKRIVDRKRVPGQFIITGSANIMMLPKISETLAGRIAFIEVLPFTILEGYSFSKDVPQAINIISAGSAKRCWDVLNSIKPRGVNLEKVILRGGYPLAWLENNDVSRNEWFRGYVRTYLERDVRDLSRIQKLYDYQKFLSLSAFRCGQILSRSDLARDAGIPYTTANHYFDLLLATYQIFLVEPYFKNIGKRLIKSPKLMWNDTGLALHLQGLSRWADAERLGRTSFLVENKIALELKALLSVYLPFAKLYYWRTAAGAEIDLLVDAVSHLVPIEVKWSENITYRDIASMEIFLKDFKKAASFGIVLYRGRQLLKMRDNIFLVPFEKFLL